MIATLHTDDGKRMVTLRIETNVAQYLAQLRAAGRAMQRLELTLAKAIGYPGKRPTLHWQGASWLHRLIYNAAWPSYACELCVGQEYWQGCYCDYHGAPHPGGPSRWPPEAYYEAMRWLWSWCVCEPNEWPDWHPDHEKNAAKFWADDEGMHVG